MLKNANSGKNNPENHNPKSFKASHKKYRPNIKSAKETAIPILPTCPNLSEKPSKKMSGNHSN